MAATQNKPVEYEITTARLIALTDNAETVLDEKESPLDLNFSQLSGYEAWVIEADFGEATATIVTCHWIVGACFVARGEYLFWLDTNDIIPTHKAIIPYVKGWLGRTLLRGIMRDCDALECPHLEIYGRTS